MNSSSRNQERAPERKPSSRVGVIGVLLVGILMPIGIYVLLYREPLVTLDQISSETLITLEQGIRDRTATLSALQALDAQYRSLDPSVTHVIFNAIPNQQQTPELIVNMTQIIQQSGGSLKDFSIHESVLPKESGSQKTTIEQIQLTMNDVGYELLKKLIRTIYSNGRVLTIRSLEFAPEDSSASVGLDAYYTSGK